MGNKNRDPNLKCEVESVLVMDEERQMVQGTIRFQALRDLEMGSLEIQVMGEELLYWRTRKSMAQKGPLYKQPFGFMAIRKEIMRFDSFNLERGMYQIPFRMTVPTNLPIPFISKLNNMTYGKIRYTASCIFKHPDREDDLKYSSPIEFIKNLDYKTTNSSCLQSVIVQLQKNIKCCCFKKGHLNGSIRLSKSSYIIGEKASILIKLNELESPIDIIEVSFRRRIHLQGSTQSTDYYNELRRFKLPGIRASQNSQQLQYDVMLSSKKRNEIQPSFIGRYLIISYELSFTIYMEGLCSGTTYAQLPFFLENPWYEWGQEETPEKQTFSSVWLPKRQELQNLGKFSYKQDHPYSKQSMLTNIHTIYQSLGYDQCDSAVLLRKQKND